MQSPNSQQQIILQAHVTRGAQNQSLSNASSQYDLGCTASISA